MADKYKINVVIGGRNYPMTVASDKEEQGVRAAALKINKLIANFEDNYAVNDKQDVLAMCALQFASILEVKRIEEDEQNDGLLSVISKLNTLIEKQLA